MALIEMKVDPQVLERIAKALEELVRLETSRLLVDGYLRPPAERVLSTPADVRVIDSKSKWTQTEQEQRAQRRREQLMEEMRAVSDDLPLLTDSASLYQSDLP